MKRWLSCLLALWLCGIVFVGVAQQVPRVVQPEDARYSAADRASLDEAIQALERVLRDGELASQRTLGRDGWDRAAFAAFTAGSLERLGYETAIVRADDGTAGGRVWVLVGIELGPTAAWVPVEPVTDPTRRQMTLGAVAFDGSGPRYDAQYVGYDALVELPENAPPIAKIRPPARNILQMDAAWFGHTSVDPDGEIVLYEWTFPGAEPVITAASSVWFAFETTGAYTVGLTVTDRRGAQASTSVTVDVVEDLDCGCH